MDLWRKKEVDADAIIDKSYENFDESTFKDEPTQTNKK